jgi:peptidoglycan-associated lipoprotein
MGKLNHQHGHHFYKKHLINNMKSKENIMRLNKIVKALAVSIPLFALAACSSSDSEVVDQQSQVETNAAAQAEAAKREAEQVKVAAAKREAEITAKKEQALEALRSQHIVYFEFDQSTLSSEFSSILDAHSSFLSANPSVSVLVEGHADERGTPEYNIALSERRAKAVTAYLENMGVASSQISIVSYGEEKAMVKDRSESAFAKNRRAVLVY